FLSEIEITNLQGAVKINGTHVIANPLEMTLNGGPMKASIDADVGVPGYTYALNFNMDKVPVAPVVNTLMPDRRGDFSGVLSGNANIKGAGITGASLQKNLAGGAG